jgi:hypothetical protein
MSGMVRPIFAGVLYASAAMLVVAGAFSMWMGLQGF